MRLLYADTSAVVRAYFTAEAGHDQLRALLLEGTDTVVTSELARTEFASAAVSAGRSNRISDPGAFIARFDADCLQDGLVTLLPLRPVADLSRARTLLAQHTLSTLDAIHLAVAVDVAGPMAAGMDFLFVTRDGEQAAAASAVGLTVA